VLEYPSCEESPSSTASRTTSWPAGGWRACRQTGGTHALLTTTSALFSSLVKPGKCPTVRAADHGANRRIWSGKSRKVSEIAPRLSALLSDNRTRETARERVARHPLILSAPPFLQSALPDPSFGGRSLYVRAVREYSSPIDRRRSGDARMSTAFQGRHARTMRGREVRLVRLPGRFPKRIRQYHGNVHSLVATRTAACSARHLDGGAAAEVLPFSAVLIRRCNDASSSSSTVLKPPFIHAHGRNSGYPRR